MNFDPVARCYWLLERIAFGYELQRARVEFLREVAEPRRVLIIGEGDGRFVEEFARRFSRTKIDVVDSSERMVDLARLRLGENSRVRFFCEDVMRWTLPSERYDLVVTHFVLDCFREEKLKDVVGRLAGRTTPECQWLLADFCRPSRGLGKWRARIWLAVMYRFFKVAARIEADELIDPSRFLEAAGFVRADRKYFLDGIVKSERWERRGQSIDARGDN